MTGNQKLVIFNLAIIFPIFVLTIIFPIFVLAAPRDGSSSDLDLSDLQEMGRAADISIFMDNEDDDPLGVPEIEGDLDLVPPIIIEADGPFDPMTGLLINPDQVSLKLLSILSKFL